jgi:hypothetical protein
MSPTVCPLQVLPAAAKALLLRLLLRKRTWFQLATLAYADVPQPDTAASRLAAVGLLQVRDDSGFGLCVLNCTVTLHGQSNGEEEHKGAHAGSVHVTL